MHEMILCKLGEVVLKGLNRRSFEDKLMANVNRRVAKCGNFRIYAKQSTIYVEPKDENCDIEAAFEGCKKVFGIIAVSKALPCEKDVQKIIGAAKEYLADEMRTSKSFKVESKRADKTFPLTSIQISQQVGGALHQAFPTCEVNVHDPELVVHIEIRDDAAYVHGPAEEGAGGLPIGMGGVAVSLLSGGIDSPVAGYLMARRGLRVDAVHFHSFPYTGERARQKVEELARLVGRYVGDVDFFVVPFTHVQEVLRDTCSPEYFTILTRRFMVRITEAIALSRESGCLITGESLGQVASQTLEGLLATNCVAQRLPILRPLIGMDKEDIVAISRKIGTFETSIEPYEDCCALFSPKHPKTKPKLPELEREEAKLDVEGLVREAVEGTQLTLLRYGRD
mgnify:CR=1 FL=1